MVFFPLLSNQSLLHLSLQWSRHASVTAIASLTDRIFSLSFASVSTRTASVTAIESAHSESLRAVLSPEDGEPVRTVCAAYGCMARGTRACATHGRPLWQHVRRMSLDAKPQADKIRYLSTKNAAEHEEAASQLTPLEVDRRTEMRRRLRADQARAHSPALPLPRALSCAPARSLVLARSPACPVLLPPWP